MVVRQKEKRFLRLQQEIIRPHRSDLVSPRNLFDPSLKHAFYDNGQVHVTSVCDLNAAFVFQPTSNAEGVKMQLVAQGV